MESILLDLQRSQLVITQALHGAIVVEALRVTWMRVTAYRGVLEVKWHAGCGSVDLSYRSAASRELKQET
jgi:succinoglycan biosynthesis protein ExoV